MKGAFLVNASRSGSTMMSTILRQHPDVLSLSELMTTQGSRALLPGAISGDRFWRQLSAPTRLMRQLANPDSAPSEFLYHKVANSRFDPYRCPPILAVTLPHLFDDPDPVFDELSRRVPQFPRQTRANHYRALIETLGTMTGRKNWVERSGGSLLATATLANRFPKAKFVAILRDGRDVTLSMQGYKPARLLVWFWKRARSVGLNIFDPQRHIGSARWIAWAEQLAGPVLPIRHILNTPPSIEDAAGCWSDMFTQGATQFMTLPSERQLVMRYEDVTADPRAALMQMSAFLDLPKNEQWLTFGASVPKRFPPRYLSLSTDDQRRLADLTARARALSDKL